MDKIEKLQRLYERGTISRMEYLRIVEKFMPESDYETIINEKPDKSDQTEDSETEPT